jgi:hypothetical protein
VRSTATFSAEGTLEEQYFSDYRNHVRASHVAVYDTKGTYNDSEEKHRVTWFKEGASRFRYDLEGTWNGGNIDQFRVFIDIVSKTITLCSEDEDFLGGSGCCDDDSCADGAGNFVYWLALPLELPDPADIDDELTDYRIERAYEDTIAGYDARCYQLVSTRRGSTQFETCFTADGVVAKYRHSDGSSNTQRVLEDVRELFSDDLAVPEAAP